MIDFLTSGHRRAFTSRWTAGVVVLSWSAPRPLGLNPREEIQWIDHPVFGRIVVPTNPLRFHGADKVATVPSPEAGQHNSEVLAEWLGMSEDEVKQLHSDGVM